MTRVYDFIDIISELPIPEANAYIETQCGIINFFLSEDEKDDFISFWGSRNSIVAEDRVCYGDWQTPEDLATKICEQHLVFYGEPEILIEPTCGTGSFVLAALQIFTSLKEVYAIEINYRYINELKAKILFQSFGKTRNSPNPKIHIYRADFFNFDFAGIFEAAKNTKRRIAIIGNPPWVTNSKQGLKKSNNLPVKANMYQLRGIDAITGKSNFDISEAMVLSLLSYSKDCQGAISILLKNSVIRNLVMKQRRKPLSINKIKQCPIDSNKEFNVSVDASCMIAKFSSQPEETCEIIDFNSQEHISTYGWTATTFVSDLKAYKDYASFDGQCPYVWRSGVKHDCSSILELEMREGGFCNKLGEMVDIEDDLIYPLMKSSDIGKHNSYFRKYILIPQRFVGDDNSYIRNNYPKTFDYLSRNKAYFDRRKSSIYKNRDPFSIFGVGDYTFMPYKIAVSALYKKIEFVLIKPYNSKPVILDDTCYQLGFNSFEEAQNALEAFQSEEITKLISALSFSDAKRVVTKSLLMRLNINALPGSFHRQIENSGCQRSLFD